MLVYCRQDPDEALQDAAARSDAGICFYNAAKQLIFQKKQGCGCIKKKKKFHSLKRQLLNKSCTSVKENICGSVTVVGVHLKTEPVS